MKKLRWELRTIVEKNEGRKLLACEQMSLFQIEIEFSVRRLLGIAVGSNYYCARSQKLVIASFCFCRWELIIEWIKENRIKWDLFFFVCFEFSRCYCSRCWLYLRYSHTSCKSNAWQCVVWTCARLFLRRLFDLSINVHNRSGSMDVAIWK